MEAAYLPRRPAAVPLAKDQAVERVIPRGQPRYAENVAADSSALWGLDATRVLVPRVEGIDEFDRPEVGSRTRPEHLPR